MDWENMRASQEQVREAIQKMEDLEKHVLATGTEGYTRFELNFLETHLDRAERFGIDTYLSIPQTELIGRMYAKHILGDKDVVVRIRGEQPKKRFNRQGE